MNSLELQKSASLSIALKKNAKQRVIDLSLAESKKTNLVEFVCNPRISKRKNYLVFSIKVKVATNELPNLEFGLHWGRVGEAWADQFFVSEEVMYRESTGTVDLLKAVNPTAPGQYGLTLFIRSKVTGERYWLVDYGIPNQRFDISSPFIAPISSSAKRAVALVDEIVSLSQTLDNLRDYQSFAKFLIRESRASSRSNFNQNLLEIVKSDAALRQRIEGFAKQFANPENSLKKNEGLRALAILRSIGIAEVVFVSPEGPNASLGGLSQVIKGLSQALSRKKINVTLVLPLYEESNGRKHQSAEQVLSDGLDVFGKKVSVKKFGSLRFNLGHTRNASDGDLKTPAEIIEVNVYKAVRGNIKVFLLRNARYARKLYQFSSSDDQLRQALFISRAAIELIKNPLFGISPQVVVSNDWLTALVPTLLKTDREFRKSKKLNQLKACHIIHNAGRAYQGKLFVNQYGEDLWPILNLADEHFFGLQDSEDPSRLNLTKGAVYHSDALVTVSKPYAEQLLTVDGGEGLAKVLSDKKANLFGISNGVDLNAIQKALWQNIEKENSIGRFTTTAFSTRLDSLKAYAKVSVQKKLLLPVGIDTKLISLVGRITEQKGLGLLVAKLSESNDSLLSEILSQGMQVIIAGPVSAGDKSAQKVCKNLEALKEIYPNQLRLIFEYIPHDQAMEITHASDIFLMPSRYEPGGITQLEALASGALVVARNVGGLKATLTNVDKVNHTGNAFLFDEFKAEDFARSLDLALDYLSNTKRLSSLRLRNARSKNDWSDRIESYLAIFQNSINALSFSFLESRKQHLETLRPK